MRPNQRQGQRAKGIPSEAEVNRRAEGPPRPRHPILATGPHATNRISTPPFHNHHGTPLTQYPYPQNPYPQYLYPQYPGSQNPGTQPGFQQEIRALDGTHRPNIDGRGIPRVNDYFPPLQEVFGQFPPTFNDQMFAEPPEPRAGIPTSMAAFDSTSLQSGYNAPYFLPNLGYGGSSHGQGVSPDPFRSLLSTPYLLPSPLLGTPSQQPALTQDPHRFPSQVLPSLATTHEQTRSREARDQGGYALENQTFVDPRDLDIVQHNFRAPLSPSEHQAFDQNEWNDSLYNEQNAGNINRSSHLVSRQQLQTPTRPRAPHRQAGSYANQGQGSEKRKRRDNSSPEDEPSPSSLAHETNPTNDTRPYFGPQQENRTPTRAQSGKHQDQARRLIVRLPHQSGILSSAPSNERATDAMVEPRTLDVATELEGTGKQKPYPCDTCGKRYGSSDSLRDHYRKYCKREREDRRRSRRQPLNPPEAESGLVMADHERPAEVTNRVLAEGNEIGEQQLVDDAQNQSPLAQDPGPPSTPPRRPSAKKQRALQSPFFTELDAYNGVVTPSKLEPGEAPRVPSWSKGQQPLKVGAECPICGVRFGRNGHLQQHFLACARKNGNPNGHHWDELLEDR